MNEENLRKRIRFFLEEIKSNADPVLLNRCRSIFRQEVSFFNRSYMAAYLLLLSEGGAGSPEGLAVQGKSVSDQTKNHNKKNPLRKDLFRKNPLRREEAKNAASESSGEDSRSDSPKLLSEEESVQLFVSIGRNRKVFPREILAYITAKAKLARDDIGMIRILDNYSFIQVRKTAADTVIEALNGQNFRGRTLTVNYARNRREEEDSDSADLIHDESTTPP